MQGIASSGIALLAMTCATQTVIARALAPVAISYTKQVKLVSHAGDCHARKLARNDGVEKFSCGGLPRSLRSLAMTG